MREENLHRLLTVATEDVRPTHPAATGWERARRVRRARRAAGATVLAVALLTGGTALALRPADRPPPATTATPGKSPTPHPVPVQTPPAELAYPGHPLGRLGDPVGATLSDRPVSRALALHQPVDPGTGVASGIRVLGDDGVVRDLDVFTPAPTRDAWGNEAVPLKSGSLSPDGRTAAFAQTDEVVVVDLTTAAVRRHPLKGYLEQVVWSGDRLLVGDDDTTYELDPSTGASRKVPVSPWNVVAPDSTAPPNVLLELGGTPPNLTAVRWSDDETHRGYGAVDFRALPPGHRVDEFYGRGWQRGERVARAGWITTDTMGGLEGVALLNARTRVVTYLLDLGRDRWKGCCEVLGWDSDGAVLLRHNPGGLLRWQPETGEVTGVTRNLFGAVSLAAG
ncbi:hypothetical protein GA0070610_5642 [Micromonospora echinofusca]|uniref:WD40-like Beta Propeller Repeat n=1 Tax=Micromonospora echinofusca TaxID=47858 RepID=A0A1C5GHK6_MICEH|nr:hypothetical protein [Micromonospora echinofusca]SCG19275.1 hypothetical protein GA0070610_5642 [Micromonospora echinofusca]